MICATCLLTRVSSQVAQWHQNMTSYFFQFKSIFLLFLFDLSRTKKRVMINSIKNRFNVEELCQRIRQHIFTICATCLLTRMSSQIAQWHQRMTLYFFQLSRSFYYFFLFKSIFLLFHYWIFRQINKKTKKLHEKRTKFCTII